MANNKNIRFILDEKVEVFVTNTSKLRIQHQKQQDNMFFRKKVSDGLVFQKNNCGGFGFKADLPLVDGYEYIMQGIKDFGCKYFLIDIQVRCPIAGNWLSKYKGRFSKYDCEFDLDAQTINAKTEPDDGYSCFLAKYDIKYNLIDNNTNFVHIDKRPLQVKTGRYVQYRTYSFWIYGNSDLPTDVDPDLDLDLYGMINYPINVGGNYYLWVLAYEWADWRFSINAEVNDALSQTAGHDIWVRKYVAGESFRHLTVLPAIPVGADTTRWSVLFGASLPGVGHNWFVETGGKEYVNPNIRDTILVSNALNNMISRMQCPKLNSVSVGIMESNDNYVLGTTNFNPLKKMRITQKSNVVRYDASATATKFEFSLKELLKWLAHLFQLYPIIEDTDFGNKRMRLEHISWFKFYNDTNLWDLTVTNPDTNKGYNKYSYDKSDLNYKETWSVGDVKDLDVVYGSNCANTDTEKKYDEAKIWLLINQMIGNEDSGYDGVVFMYQNWNIAAFGEAIDYWTTIKQYWREERPFLTCVRPTTLENVTWKSTTLAKKQEEIIIPFCCKKLDKQVIKTSIGIGFLDSAEEDLSTGTLKFKVKYQR